MARGRVQPYCSPAMLEALGLYAKGKIDWAIQPEVYQALRARGWIRDGMITDAGRDYYERHKNK